MKTMLEKWRPYLTVFRLRALQETQYRAAALGGLVTQVFFVESTENILYGLLFVLLYFPCIATIVAIKQESGSWRWAIFAACYTTALAWLVAFVVNQIGNLFVS